MPTVTFTDPESAAHAAEQIDLVAARYGNSRILLEAARGLLADDEASVFDSEGATIGEHWPQLNADYAATKGNSRMLVATGALRAAVTDPGNVHVSANAATLTPGAIPYAHFHITGTSRMPARPFMGIAPQTERAFTEIARRYLTP